MRLKIKYGKRQFIVDVTEYVGHHLSITVRPDLSITAKVPQGSDEKILEQRLKKKASWIAKQIDYFSQFHPLISERKYISGETHYYLGRQYRLKIRKLKNTEVKLKGGFFMMGLPDPHNSMQAKRIILAWYDKHAVLVLNKRVAKYLPRFVKLGATDPTIKFRRMKKRWGSCRRIGTIVFNLDLIKAPIHCIDYVIIHELCHLLSAKHDEKFYHLLGKILPDWKKHKEQLEKTIM